MSKKKDSLKPWLSRPAINRSVTLPLTRPLTQRLSNLNEFHPNELDPYLLFDARDSMIGTLENPTLDLDPSDPDTLDVITATRAGVATYTDADGLIQSADPNTVRVDHVDGVPMILVEPSATNLVEYSEDFSQSYWTKSATLIDSNQTEAPNGSMVADKLKEEEEGVNRTHLVFRAGITNLGTISVYAKQGDENNRLFQIRRDGGSNSWSWFDLQAGTVEYQTQGVASIEDAGNGWYRCTFTPTNSNGTVVFGLSNGGLGRGESYQGDGTSGVYIWGAQVEEGSVITSYIPTSGSTVTRAADDLVISGSAFSDFYNQSEGTIYTEFIPRRVDYYQHLYEFSNGGPTNRINVHLENGNARFYLASGGTVYANTIAATNVTTGELHRTGFSYKTNDAPASFDGSTEITDITVTVPSGIDRVFLGALYTQANDFYLNGHIKRLIYWPYHSDSL